MSHWMRSQLPWLAKARKQLVWFGGRSGARSAIINSCFRPMYAFGHLHHNHQRLCFHHHSVYHFGDSNFWAHLSIMLQSLHRHPRFVLSTGCETCSCWECPSWVHLFDARVTLLSVTPCLSDSRTRWQWTLAIQKKAWFILSLHRLSSSPTSLSVRVLLVYGFGTLPQDADCWAMILYGLSHTEQSKSYICSLRQHQSTDTVKTPKGDRKHFQKVHTLISDVME